MQPGEPNFLVGISINSRTAFRLLGIGLSASCSRPKAKRQLLIHRESFDMPVKIKSITVAAVDRFCWL